MKDFEGIKTQGATIKKYIYSVPCTTQPSAVNRSVLFCKIHQERDKQCLITADAENVFPFQSTRRTTVSQFVFETFGTEH